MNSDATALAWAHGMGDDVMPECRMRRCPECGHRPMQCERTRTDSRGVVRRNYRCRKCGYFDKTRQVARPVATEPVRTP